MQTRLVINTPATSTDLTTLSAAAAELGGTVDTALVQRWIAAASGAIVRHTGRTFARETVTETFWLPRYCVPALRLDRIPVASITSVTVDGAVLDAADYLIDAGSGLLTRLSSDTPADWLANKVVVVYQAGYVLPGAASATLPADIERACIITLAAMSSSQGRDPQLRSEAADGIGSQSWLDPRAEDGALPQAAATLLAPWRRNVIA
jgi:hypothetical protein